MRKGGKALSSSAYPLGKGRECRKMREAGMDKRIERWPHLEPRTTTLWKAMASGLQPFLDAKGLGKEVDRPPYEQGEHEGRGEKPSRRRPWASSI